MIGTMDALFTAALLFIGIHVLSSTPLRALCVRGIGEARFLAAFSLVSVAAMAWLIAAYAAAPLEPVWSPPAWTRWVPVLVMPVALFFAVAGVSTRNPVSVGQGAALEAPKPAIGIITVTRHPLFWGIGLWALAHLAARGDRASLYFFGCFAVLALAGMKLVDKKKEETFGAAWGPFAMTTSALPFAAALQGRARIDWRGIGWWRPALALALYAALILLHRTLFGASPFPV